MMRATTVVAKFGNVIGGELRNPVMCQQGEEQWSEDTAPQCSGAQDDSAGEFVANANWL